MRRQHDVEMDESLFPDETPQYDTMDTTEEGDDLMEEEEEGDNSLGDDLEGEILDEEEDTTNNVSEGKDELQIELPGNCEVIVEPLPL